MQSSIRTLTGYAQNAYKTGILSLRRNRLPRSGWRRFCRRQGLPVEGGAPQALDDSAWLLLEPLVARRMLAQFGGRLRVAVSGGAPLSQPIARCFLGLGLPILQGYGMTETSPVVATNAPDDNDPATVGRPLAGVEVCIGDNLELLVRGPNVMRATGSAMTTPRAPSSMDGYARATRPRSKPAASAFSAA